MAEAAAEVKSDPTLRRWFLRFNRKYFDDSLRKDTVIYWEACNGKLALSWKDDDNRPHIRIDPCIGFSQSIAKYKLLHEMAHQSQPRATHGKVFQDEMKRLAMADAFWHLW